MSHFNLRAPVTSRIAHSLSCCTLSVLLAAGAGCTQDQHMKVINIAPPQIVRLWDGDAPSAANITDAEKTDDKGNDFIVPIMKTAIEKSLAG